MRKILLSLLLFVLPLSMRAADDNALDPQRVGQLRDCMMRYCEELNKLSRGCNIQMNFADVKSPDESIIRIFKQKVSILNSNYQAIDFRMTTFLQTEQVEIADDESLMSLMSQLQQLKQSVADSITLQQNKYNAIVDFVSAEQFILSQDTIYKVLYKKVLELSLVKKLAPQLDRLKAEEQTRFADIDGRYQKLVAAVPFFPELDKRAKVVEEQYFSLKTLSSNIQAMEFKPFVERAKSYLIGLACVGVLLMFINMVVAKIGAVKKARETIKNQKKLFEKNNEINTPTI